MRRTAAIVVAVSGSLVATWWPGPLAGPWLLVVWGLVVVGLRPTGASIPLLVTAAILVRLPLLAAPPRWSDDVWRYLWEGQVWRAGFNPFTSAPDSEELIGVRNSVWALVNHREVSSVYPPLAQLLFAVIPGGAFGWKLAMGAADLVTTRLLHRRDPAAGWLWALLPLPALESAGSGHLEGVGLCATALALSYGPAWAWVGAMIKLLPGVLLLRVHPRWWGYALVATIVVVLPLAGPGLLRGLETYRETWSYNGSVYPLMRMGLSEVATRRTLEVVGAAAVAGIVARSTDPGRIAVWTFGAFVILSPTVHPWYVLWPLLAALWNRQRAWTVLAVLVPVTYVVLGGYDATTSTWHEPWWPRWVVYPPFYVALLVEGWVTWTRPGPASVG